MAALDHAESYQQLFLSDYGNPPQRTRDLANNSIQSPMRIQQLDMPDSGIETNDVVPLTAAGALHTSASDQEDRQVRFRVIRGLLLMDLNRLIESISYLENSLYADQDRTWIAQTVIVAGTQFVIGSASTRKLLDANLHPRWALLIQSVTLPVALYQIVNSEFQIRSTIAVRRGLENLYARVKDGEKIDEEDLECIVGGRWNSVPWHKIE